ncbi:MAG: SDR family oxidoreductase [Alphaproteobacteria bacterium]
MQNVEGKIAWVTGAGSGIGAAAAETLAGAGMTVTISGRRKDALEKTAKAIRDKGGKVHLAPLDVVDGAAAKAVADAIVARDGRIDLLFNNAGLNVTKRNLADISLADFKLTVDVNLTGAYNVVAAVLPQMRKQQDGLIVNLASWASRYVGKGAGVAYCASKHGMLVLNEAINQEECGYGIRASAICPADVDTPILDKRAKKPAPETLALILKPQDLADTVLYLARLPARVCINEILISPTKNKTYLPDLP